MEPARKSIAILDANAFISMSSINNLASNTRLVTTADVLLELKDLKTKEFVDSLPYEIEVVDPDEKVLEIVKEFAKKTGDIASLSQVDMELIAVAYALYKKEGLEQLIRKDPPPILEKDDLEEYVKENDMDELSEDEEDEEEEERVQPQEIAKVNE
jgi:RNA-binding protein NOB1